MLPFSIGKYFNNSHMTQSYQCTVMYVKQLVISLVLEKEVMIIPNKIT